uniref:Uncharacterized protein n=1 Tax=Anguilla anguilla TaxID=7936 RepID=A0A0E9QQS5_ANGAN
MGEQVPGEVLGWVPTSRTCVESSSVEFSIKIALSRDVESVGMAFSSSADHTAKWVVSSSLTLK